MPTLDLLVTKPFVKLLLVGDSGTGKTGALYPLIEDGYKLKVLDYDNKIAGGILPILIRSKCPDKLKNVDVQVLRDQLKASALGPIVDGLPQAFVKGMELMDKWPDGTMPKAWGVNDPDVIFVLDSLTFMSDAAFAWARGMNPSAKDPRQWFYTAQQAVEGVIALLTSAKMECNVIVIAHVDWQNRPDGTMKGYPTTVGRALGPTIPAYFENMALCQTMAGKRTIQTAPTALIDLKSPAAFKLVPTMPQETGLRDFFKTLRG